MIHVLGSLVRCGKPWIEFVIPHSILVQSSCAHVRSESLGGRSVFLSLSLYQIDFYLIKLNMYGVFKNIDGKYTS